MSSDTAVNVYLWLDGGVFYRRLSLTDLLVVLASGPHPSEAPRREAVQDDTCDKGTRRFGGLRTGPSY